PCEQLEVVVVPTLPSRDAELDELERPVWVLTDEEPIDVALQGEVGAVVADQGNAVGDEILVDQVLRAPQPVQEGLEEARLENLLGCVEPSGERRRRLLVRLQEQRGLRAGVFADR